MQSTLWIRFMQENSGSMLMNCWYVAAEAADVTDEPKAVHMLGQDLVVFRDSSGQAHCLSDICVNAPFSRRVPDRNLGGYAHYSDIL
jgi:nitrite reductase/ring-hydroxylating ferredoxin subunit